MVYDFELYLHEVIKNEKTIRAYVKDVESFLTYIKEEEIQIGQIKEIHVKKYNLFLAENQYSNHTIARKSSALRLFFKYLRKQGIMQGNPMEDIKQPQLLQRESKISEDEQQQLEEIIESPRDKLLFRLLLHEGLRISEVLSCAKKHYHHAQGIIYLPNRAVTLSEGTKKMVESIKGDEETLLICGAKNKALTESGIYFILKRYFREVNRPDLRPIDLIKMKK